MDIVNLPVQDCYFVSNSHVNVYQRVNARSKWEKRGKTWTVAVAESTILSPRFSSDEEFRWNSEGYRMVPQVGIAFS